MADDDVINPLSTPTANYGWAKPAVGGDQDAWGGMINTDLDGIDSTVHGIDVSNATKVTAAGAAAAAPVQSVATKTGAVTLQHTDITDWTATLAPYAPLASPTFTGSPAAPTPTPQSDSSTKLATTAFVQGAVTANLYVLPQATTTVLGGVKVDGTTITAAAGVISAAAPTPTNSNKLDNGDMSVNQRAQAVGSGIAFTLSAGIMLDRWTFYGTKPTKWNWGINYPYSPPAGFQYCQGFQVLTSASAGSADYNAIAQTIEWDNFVDAQWGTASAQPMTLSFWAISTATGDFTLAVYSGGTTTYRLYLTTFNISTANTWQKFTITIPGDASSIWAPGTLLGVWFDLGSGTNLNSATLGWQTTTTALKYSSGLNITTTVGAKFAFTGVKLELGSVATPFVFDHPQVKLARCQRYYQTQNILIGYAYNLAGQVQSCSYFIPTMRASPTITNGTITYSNCSGISLGPLSNSGVYANVIVTANGMLTAQGPISLSAEI